MSTFTAKCPSCNNKFEAEEDWIGQIGECPACRTKFKINKQPAILTSTTNAIPDAGKVPKKGLNSKIIYISIGLLVIIITNVCTFIYFSGNKALPKTETKDVPKISDENKPGPTIIKDKAVEAREKLGFMNIPYDYDSFIKYIEANDIHVVELFLTSGFNPKTEGGGALSALMIAAKTKKDNTVAIIDLLLKAGADLNAKVKYGDYEGFSAYQFALYRDDKTTAEYLLNKGADKNIDGLNNYSCNFNLKQIGLALRMYAMENKDNFPTQDGAEGLELLRSKGYLEYKKWYLCARESDTMHDNTPLNNKTVDYVYFGGFKEGGNDGYRLPIAFDKPNNHKGCVNVLFKDLSIEKIKGNFKSCTDIVNYFQKDLKTEIYDKLMEKAKAQDLILQK